MEITRLSSVLVKYGNKVLLCKRNTDGSYSGMWSLPGGHLEKGETTKDCAKREFFEETSIDIDDQELNLLGVITSRTQDGKKLKSIMYVYLLDTDTEIKPDLQNAMDGHEHTDWGYFTLNKIRPENTGVRLYKFICGVMNK